MKPKSAIKKGKLFENWLVSWLRNKKIDPHAIRTPGSGSGRFKGDIYTPNLPLVIEAKNHARPNLGEWIKQAQTNTMDYTDWTLIWHPPQTPMESSVVIIPLHLAEKFFKQIKLK